MTAPTSDRTIQIRSATRADVGAMCSIFFGSINDLHRRHGIEELDPEDRGWLWLLDDRYRQPEVVRLLPAWWGLGDGLHPAGE